MCVCMGNVECLKKVYIRSYSSKQMAITSSRKPDKLGGRLSSEVEHWTRKPGVRGPIPRVSQIYRAKRMIDIIDC